MYKNLLFGILISMFFCGCITTKIDELEPKSYKAEDENISISAVSFDSGRWLEMSFSNKSDKPITIISDSVQFFGKSRDYSTKLVPGETRRIMDSLTIPNLMVPPAETIQKNYTSNDNDNYENFHFVYESKISYIAVCYKVGAEEKYLKVPDISLPDGIKLGTVESRWIFIHPLFIQLTGLNRKKLYKRALEKAQNKYGKEIYLSNLFYEGSWNPLSLLLYFDALGFVENGKLTADVYRDTESK